MNSVLKKEIERTFLQTLIDIKETKDLNIFLGDLIGSEEYEKIIKKLAMIYWLRKKRPRDIIKTNLEVSEKDISEVEKIMDKKGIKLAIKYMEADEFANVWSEKIKNVIK